MKDGDATPIFLGVAALIAALWFQNQSSDSQRALNQCHSDFQAFKEGVLYAR
jgi:hypothetical protein